MNTAKYILKVHVIEYQREGNCYMLMLIGF